MSARTLRREVVAFAGAAVIGVLPMSPGPATAASSGPASPGTGRRRAPLRSPAEPQRVDRNSGRLLRRLTPAERRSAR